jgi:cell division protein FtsW (lipid II flippase)
MTVATSDFMTQAVYITLAKFLKKRREENAKQQWDTYN